MLLNGLAVPWARSGACFFGFSRACEEVNTGRENTERGYLCHFWTHYNMELICLCLPCIHLLYSPYTVLNSKLNHASHLCIKNIIEEKTVQRLVSSFFNTLPIIPLSRLCQADFSDNFNQIISCSLFKRHLLWLDSGFGLGHRARGWSWCCILCFLNQQSSPLKSFLSFKMPENANIAKTNHQQPYCSLCLAFALLSTEYAWPFCSWMPNSSSPPKLCSHNYYNSGTCPLLLCCQTQPNSEARKECQILASVQPIFWNLTYEMHFGLVCFHLVPPSQSRVHVYSVHWMLPYRSISFLTLSLSSSQNRWLMSSREKVV